MNKKQKITLIAAVLLFVLLLILCKSLDGRVYQFAPLVSDTQETTVTSTATTDAETAAGTGATPETTEETAPQTTSAKEPARNNSETPTPAKPQETTPPATEPPASQTPSDYTGGREDEFPLTPIG